MPDRHSLLTRQLKRCFGSEASVPDGFAELLRAIDAAYAQSDDDRMMLERSLDLSSQELLAKNSELRAMLRAFPDIFFRLDDKGVILDCSTGRTEDLYRPVEQLLGRRVSDFMPDSLGKRFEAAIADVTASGRTAALEYALSVPSGDKQWEARLARISAGQLLMIVRDITERAKTEEALRLSEAQFRQAQRMEVVGRLAGGIAHDFNNILTTILGLSEMALSQLPPGHEIADDLREIAATGRRAANLTQQLLAFSRRQVIEPKVLSLNDALADVAKLLRRLIGEDVELVTRLAPALGLVRVDPGQLEQVVVNLCVNARDAMPQGGTLTIETHDFTMGADFVRSNPGAVAGEYVRLSVRDTGVGMSAEVQSHVFEPFFTTKPQGKGTGLGLATCYGIVKQHGGYISVRSLPESGTVFAVYLPMTRAPAAAPEKPVERVPVAMPRGTETVLVVEDELPVRTLAVRVLRMQGYNVLEAADGVEGLCVVGKDLRKDIRLVITDLVMPRVGGRELADSIGRTRPDMKIILTTGYTDDATLQQGVHDGSSPLLHKPFSPRDLALKVREVLG